MEVRRAAASEVAEVKTGVWEDSMEIDFQSASRKF